VLSQYLTLPNAGYVAIDYAQSVLNFQKLLRKQKSRNKLRELTLIDGEVKLISLSEKENSILQYGDKLSFLFLQDKNPPETPHFSVGRIFVIFWVGIGFQETKSQN
jgi:hypothetical protein